MEFVKIAIINDIFESQLLESILNERGIPHLIRSYHDDSYGGLFQMTKGWGAVYAPAVHKDDITAIIDELREQSVEIDEE